MNDQRSKTRVGYILQRFPALTQTFILNEILGLQARGLPMHIFSLERPHDSRFHEDLAKLKIPISYIPEAARSLWASSRQAARVYGKRHRRTLAYALKHTTPRAFWKFLWSGEVLQDSVFWRFLQSCYIANGVRTYDIGHFHAHFANRPTTVAFFTSMMTGIPYSFTTHAMDIYPTARSRALLAKKIRQAKFVVAVNEDNKAFLVRAADGASRHIVRVYNGIDLDRFNPSSPLQRSPFTLLCIARFVEKKRVTASSSRPVPVFVIVAWRFNVGSLARAHCALRLKRTLHASVSQAISGS